MNDPLATGQTQCSDAIGLLLLCDQRLQAGPGMAERFGDAYAHYAERTSRFFPQTFHWGAFLTTQVPDNAEEGGT